MDFYNNKFHNFIFTHFIYYFIQQATLKNDSSLQEVLKEICMKLRLAGKSISPNLKK